MSKLKQEVENALLHKDTAMFLTDKAETFFKVMEIIDKYEKEE